MKNKNQEYFHYQKRFKNLTEKRLLFLNNVKGWLLEFLAQYKKLCNYLDIWETIVLTTKKWIHKYNIHKDEIIKDENSFYEGIRLNQISFFEAIEIDNFDSFRKKAVLKFGNSTEFGGINRRGALENKLTGLEKQFDNISWGRLFALSFEKKRKKKNDLIDSINCNFIKTNESYFIISFNITLSDNAQDIFKKTIQQADIGLSMPKYNSFWTIITKKRFYLHESYIPSLKENNIRNLISDINSQVKNNITKHFNGYFNKSKIFNILPSIELFEVDEISEFKKDRRLKSYFDKSFNKYYSLEDEKIEIFLPDSNDKDYEVIQIIKQKGHGNIEKTKHDLSDWDRIESHYLIKSLTFPCIFSAILCEQTYKLNTLKREIYDQIKLSGNRNFLKQFFLLGLNSKYLSLKHKSVQILLTIKRFENEFTDRKIQMYTRDFELEKFVARNIGDHEEKNLLSYFIKNFHYRLKILDSKTKSLNEVFKALEEFNSYKTNFLLQVFSVFIAVLAFIFTFEKTRGFIVMIIQKIVEGK